VKRRHLLHAAVAAGIGGAGCSSSLSSDDRTPAHTVTVYHVDHEIPRNVTVEVENDAGETLFEQSYTMSETNEADEDATFPESTDPSTVLVTVDGTEFEKDWPNPECHDGTWMGIAVWIRGRSDSDIGVRIEANCQTVYLDS
jgi:hypothetical protein